MNLPSETAVILRFCTVILGLAIYSQICSAFGADLVPIGGGGGGGGAYGGLNSNPKIWIH